MLFSWFENNVKKIMSLAISCLFITLAVHAFLAFEELRNGANDTAIESADVSRPQSMMLDSRYAQLEKKAQELSKPLEFMVWPFERQKASKELQEIFHQQININPYDAYVWRKLSFVQSASGASYEERAWTMLKAVELGGWMTSERVLLTRHCVAEFNQFDNVIPGRCNGLIARLPNLLSVYTLSQKMGVKDSYLKWLLLKLNVEIKPLNESVQTSRSGE